MSGAPRPTQGGQSVFEQMYYQQQQQQQLQQQQQVMQQPLYDQQPVNAQQQLQYPTPPSPYPQQYGQNSAQQLYAAPYTPMPPPPPPPPYAAPQQDNDYYKGFYDGVIKPSGPVVGSAVSWLAPLFVNLALFVGPLWYMRRKYLQALGQTKANDAAKKNPMMGGLMDMMNPMKSKNYRVEVKGITFSEVIGIPEAKEDLKQYVDFLKEPKKFTRLGARLPKGCLLTGQPGTGKTLLARAVAGEASTPFLSCSGADFIEIFGGSGPKRVRELFAQAKEAAPCVVFIDEIDAIGSRNQGGRSMGGGGSSEENRTVNQLLAELDGLSSKEAIVVIAATNYPEAIDKALLREGRFDRKVNIPMPDREARQELFEFYLNRIITGDPSCKPKVQVFRTRKEGEGGEADSTSPRDKQTVENASAVEKKPVIEEKPIEVKVVPGVSNKEYAAQLADRTPGVSPAQISTIVNEAALTSAVAEEEVVPLKTLQDSIDDVLIGKKHRQRMSDASLQRTAYHEVGHAIMAWTSPLQKDVVKISIIPRGRAGGYTQQVQDEALEPRTDVFLFSQLCVLMGGRVAERIFMKDISTGAMDDLQRATRIALEKLLLYGMSKSIGQLAFKPNDRNEGRAWMNFSEDLHAKVEEEARQLVAAAYKHTEKTLLEKKDLHEKLTMLLLEKKELMKDDIERILGPRPVEAPSK
ncbi:putative ATP-dependent zinc metallopeptidase, putative,metallo-peptidase, clan MA(E), family M41 [Trypanosoma grayi]|uniref:putative ATP-dependent zinc metallopeptidase, putative,metallo-peptidase, clan MA(E), family M41 n=1 Tax=Trypanosoma grayi TaxID=71804 RepID=UPI0004F420E7|nr:putative ATP-dependent zinc metallopeptidase, putative,metallo-peptidase, clan MA(E), family M41 [Trypanosoma grayi]KEG15377.1 putative ATP-dependent zinc metallopeptidase, putative,metallo-peptidase, clan MA(E), family M41 [Trypanosoma grayi]